MDLTVIEEVNGRLRFWMRAQCARKMFGRELRGAGGGRESWETADGSEKLEMKNDRDDHGTAEMATTMEEVNGRSLGGCGREGGDAGWMALVTALTNASADAARHWVYVRPASVEGSWRRAPGARRGGTPAHFGGWCSQFCRLSGLLQLVMRFCSDDSGS